MFLLQRCNDAKPTESLDIQDSENPQFTLQELQDVLQERNELKVQVFMLQEELAYYKRYSLAQKTSVHLFTFFDVLLLFTQFF